MRGFFKNPILPGVDWKTTLHATGIDPKKMDLSRYGNSQGGQSYGGDDYVQSGENQATSNFQAMMDNPEQWVEPTQQPYAQQLVPQGRPMPGLVPQERHQIDGMRQESRFPATQQENRFPAETSRPATYGFHQDPEFQKMLYEWFLNYYKNRAPTEVRQTLVPTDQYKPTMMQRYGSTS